MPTLTTTIDLVELQCGTCGVYHAISKTKYETCQEEGGYWHCPNGHQRGFREGRNERNAMRRELDLLKQKIAQKDDEIASMRQAQDRVKRRIKNGVCPDCNRTFVDLARHMKSKHADHTH